MKHTIIALVLLGAACGGGDSDSHILHLKNQDVSEESFRAYWRAELTTNLLGGSLICKQLQGLSDEAVLTYLRAVYAETDSTPTGTLVPNATPKPGQAASQDDQLRVAAIMRGECERTY